MAKKKKKKNRKDATPKAPSSPREIRTRAETHLKAGRFRQALSAFKKLAKADPDAPLDGMDAARDGLYRQMLDKGMLEEAAMVLDQMESPGNGSASIEAIPLHFHRRNFSKAADCAARILSADDGFSPEDGRRAADALVLAFEEVPNLSEPFAGELRAVRDALRDVAEGKFEEAIASVKSIGFRSIFASWKLWIKALRAFYREEDEKARRALGGIDPNTVPASAAAVVSDLLTDAAGPRGESQKPALLEAAFSLAGCGEASVPLARAEYLWRVNRFRDSHAHLKANLQNFPTDSSGLSRSLTELYYNALVAMPQETGRKYMRYLFKSAAAENDPTGTELLWTQRSASLFAEIHAEFDEDVLRSWESYLKLHALRYGASPKVRAMVYERLGHFFGREVPDESPFSFFMRRRKKKPNIWNIQLAKRCFEKSAEADPGIHAQLNRIAFHEKLGDDSTVNRLLDRIIQDFPADKEVLFKAGARCLQRNALIKGMKYLEQALELDSMDKSLRETYLVTCTRAALRYIRNDQVEKARNLLPRMVDAADPHSDHPNRGIAYVHARWAAFEEILEDDERAKDMWRKALAQRRSSPFKLRLFHWIVGRYYGLTAESLAEETAFLRETLAGEPCIDRAEEMVDLLVYSSGFPRKVPGLPELQDKIEAHLFRVARLDMTPQRIGKFLDFAFSDVCRHEDLAETFIREALRRHPDNADFRYRNFLLGKKNEWMFWEYLDDDEVEELKTTLGLARKQNDVRTASEIQKILKKREKSEESEDDFPTPEELEAFLETLDPDRIREAMDDPDDMDDIENPTDRMKPDGKRKRSRK